jgi:hypothetical protein
MATVQKHARCVGWLFGTKSVTHRPWPPRSSDTPPLDFFLWSYVKSNVFRTLVYGLDDLKTRIRNAISAIPANMLHRTWQELEYRVDVLYATKGAHIEIY